MIDFPKLQLLMTLLLDVIKSIWRLLENEDRLFYDLIDKLLRNDLACQQIYKYNFEQGISICDEIAARDSTNSALRSYCPRLVAVENGLAVSLLLRSILSFLGNIMF
ncbi:hypothetical protein GJ496_001982 [Pomphorhynchus laevis]|nr:hypothetical protein GJ496_001982 [Pomphorhynchus laevis]